MSSMDSLNKAFKSAVHFYDSTSNFHQKIKALNYLGRSYLALSKPAEAFPTFLLADSLYQAHKIKDRPLKHSIDYYSVYAKVQFTKKLHFNETVAVYEKYKNEPRDAYVFALSEEYLARVYIDSAKYDKAIPILEKALKNDSKNYSFYRELGFAFVKQNRLNDAEKIYTKGISLSDNKFEKSEMALNMAQGYFLAKNKVKFTEWAEITRKYTEKDSQYSKYIDFFEKEWNSER